MVCLNFISAFKRTPTENKKKIIKGNGIQFFCCAKSTYIHKKTIF